ncbi:hypothetical protein CCACVL1_08023 [Corchorus capsularis]|uniref:Uncharacterized protein n=1 Tax=Corchorus capsularis TaxID=210143 RepID=A0A1R3J2N8_COCAP|nr:hypothetical protein CCACVL1_08023 [Corchorus capsularis]
MHMRWFAGQSISSAFMQPPSDRYQPHSCTPHKYEAKFKVELNMNNVE